MTQQTFETVLKTFSLTPTDALMIPIAAIMFVLLWKGLEKNLFKPFLALIEAREKATVGAEAQSESDLVQAQELSRSFDQQIQEVRVNALERKFKELDQAKKRAEQILTAAEAEAQEMLKRSRDELSRASSNVAQSLKSDADVLANEIVSRILNADAGGVARDSK